MHPRVASHFQLDVVDTEPFQVFVGNGAALQSSGKCPRVFIRLQNTFFDMPFFLFDIHSADVVLGVQWLQSLGPFPSDFSVPSMTLFHRGEWITLRGSSSVPAPLSFSQFQTLRDDAQIAHYFLFSLHAAPPDPPSPRQLPLTLTLTLLFLTHTTPRFNLFYTNTPPFVLYPDHFLPLDLKTIIFIFIPTPSPSMLNHIDILTSKKKLCLNS